MASADAASRLERALALRRIGGLESLEPELLTTLAAHARVRRLASGERLSGSSELERSLHFVLEGSIAAAHGRRRGPGSLLDPGFDADTGEAGDAVALEDSLTLVLHWDDLTELCEEHFSILLAVVRGLARAVLLRARKRPPEPLGGPLAWGAGGALDLGQRIAFLASCPTFANIPVHAVGQLAQAARPLGLRRGERLWSAGEPAGCLVAVVEGAITASAGAERADLRPGAIAGLLESIAGEVRWYTAAARTRVVALAIDIAAVFDAAEDDSETAADLLAALARSWVLSAREPGP